MAGRRGVAAAWRTVVLGVAFANPGASATATDSAAPITLISSTPGFACSVSTPSPGQFCATNRVPGNTTYDNDERCSWNVTSPTNVTLSAVDFITEADAGCQFDVFSIGTRTFCGQVGPSGVVAQPGEVLAWQSDHTIRFRGFTVCATVASTAPTSPTSAPVSPAPTAPSTVPTPAPRSDAPTASTSAPSRVPTSGSPTTAGAPAVTFPPATRGPTAFGQCDPSTICPGEMASCSNAPACLQLLITQGAAHTLVRNEICANPVYAVLVECLRQGGLDPTLCHDPRVLQADCTAAPTVISSTTPTSAVPTLSSTGRPTSVAPSPSPTESPPQQSPSAVPTPAPSSEAPTLTPTRVSPSSGTGTPSVPPAAVPPVTAAPSDRGPQTTASGGGGGGGGSLGIAIAIVALILALVVVAVVLGRRRRRADAAAPEGTQGRQMAAGPAVSGYMTPVALNPMYSGKAAPVAPEYALPDEHPRAAASQNGLGAPVRLTDDKYVASERPSNTAPEYAVFLDPVKDATNI